MPSFIIAGFVCQILGRGLFWSLSLVYYRVIQLRTFGETTSWTTLFDGLLRRGWWHIDGYSIIIDQQNVVSLAFLFSFIFLFSSDFLTQFSLFRLLNLLPFYNLFPIFCLFLVLFQMLWMMVTVNKLKIMTCHVPHLSQKERT